ncbi:unnamed protein product [Ceutorhynchus assimilis]|uniref:Uncharacterized protein n=1 Tax=Ceutorhynchus assimilis TaxID=467358 RepID=A0A9N9MND1_9CUCU|nr:unnamed protein product [Ceutorhynchus assimilis]
MHNTENILVSFQKYDCIKMAPKSLLFVIVLTLLDSIQGLHQMEDDLKKVEHALKNHLLETVLNIKISTTMIEVFAEDAKQRLIWDLKSAAQGFWKTIDMLQIASAEDVPPGCIRLATKSLEELDSQVKFEAHNKIENILSEADEEATEAISQSRIFLSEIPSLAEKIKNCNGGLCKIILDDQIVQLLRDSWKTIEESCTDFIAYREELVKNLQTLKLDADAYLEGDLGEGKAMPDVITINQCGSRTKFYGKRIYSPIGM